MTDDMTRARWRSLGLTASIGVALLVAGIPAGGAAPRLAGAAGAAASQRTGIVRYLADYVDGPAGYLVVCSPEWGPGVRLIISDEVRQGMREGGAPKRGDFLQVTSATGATGRELVTAVSKFNAPAGMDAPNAYVLDEVKEERAGSQPVLMVRLSRLGQSKVAIVAGKAGAGGRPGPDPVLVERLKGFKPGDVVEAELLVTRAATTLQDVDKPRAEQVAEFLRLSVVKQGGKMVPGIVLRVGEAEQVLALPVPAPGAPASVTAALALARRLKPGQGVRFTARDEAAPAVLRTLRPDALLRPGRTEGTADLETLYCRVHLETQRGGATARVTADDRRAEQRAVVRGCERAAADEAAADKAGIGVAQARAIREALGGGRPAPGRGGRAGGTPADAVVSAAERDQMAQAFRQWLVAGDEERGRVAHQIEAVGAEWSMRYRAAADERYEALKALLTPEQLEAVREIGREGKGSE